MRRGKRFLLLLTILSILVLNSLGTVHASEGCFGGFQMIPEGFKLPQGKTIQIELFFGVRTDPECPLNVWFEVSDNLQIIESHSNYGSPTTQLNPDGTLLTASGGDSGYANLWVTIVGNEVGAARVSYANYTSSHFWDSTGEVTARPVNQAAEVLYLAQIMGTDFVVDAASQQR